MNIDDIYIGDIVRIKPSSFFNEYRQNKDNPIQGSRLSCFANRANECAMVIDVGRDPDTDEPYVLLTRMFGMRWPLDFIEGPLEIDEVFDEKFKMSLDAEYFWYRLPTDYKNYFYMWYLRAKKYDRMMEYGSNVKSWFEKMFGKNNLDAFEKEHHLLTVKSVRRKD